MSSDPEHQDKREHLRKLLRKLIIIEPQNPIEVPELVDGFGTIEIDTVNCTSCGACVRACKSQALVFEREFDMETLRKQANDDKFENRQILLELIEKLNPEASEPCFKVPVDLLGFGKLKLFLKNCIFCGDCVSVCSFEAISAKRFLDLKEFLT